MDLGCNLKLLYPLLFIVFLLFNDDIESLIRMFILYILEYSFVCQLASLLNIQEVANELPDSPPKNAFLSKENDIDHSSSELSSEEKESESSEKEGISIMEPIASVVDYKFHHRIDDRWISV